MKVKTFRADNSTLLEGAITDFLTAHPIQVSGCNLTYSTSPPKSLVASIFYEDSNNPSNQTIKVCSATDLNDLDTLVNATAVDFDENTISVSFNGEVTTALLITKPD